MSTSCKKIVLKKLSSHNTIWHPESTLVFKSQKDKLVIGRYVDDEIIPLDDEALSLCETWKFKPDESLFDGEEEEAEKVDEEAENEESEEENVDKETVQVPTVIPKETVQVPIVIPKETVQVPIVIHKEESKEPTHLIKSSENRSIHDITNKFTKQVFAEFDILIEDNTSLKSQLAENLSAFADLQKKYDDIKKKFDTMKSLFN